MTGQKTVFAHVMDLQKKQALKIRERKLNPAPKPKLGRPKGSKKKSALDNLTPRQAEYLKHRMEKKSKYESAKLAGYPESSALAPSSHIENANVKRAYQELIRKHAPLEKIARRVAEGLDAKKVIYSTQDGKISDTKEIVDHTERRKHAQLAAEMAGAWTPKNEVQVEQTLSPDEIRIMINLNQKLNLFELPPEQLHELAKAHVPLQRQTPVIDAPVFDNILRAAPEKPEPPTGEGRQLTPEEAQKLIAAEDARQSNSNQSSNFRYRL